MTKLLTKEDLDEYESETKGRHLVEVESGDLLSLIAAARELGSLRPLGEQELVQLLTEAMRAADQAFDRVGGSTRHHVRDCLIPELERMGLGVVRLPSPPEKR